MSGWPHELVEEFRYPSLLFIQGVVKSKWIQRLDILCQKLLVCTEEWESPSHKEKSFVNAVCQTFVQAVLAGKEQILRSKIV